MEVKLLYAGRVLIWNSHRQYGFYAALIRIGNIDGAANFIGKNAAARVKRSVEAGTDEAFETLRVSR